MLRTEQICLRCGAALANTDPQRCPACGNTMPAPILDYQPKDAERDETPLMCAQSSYALIFGFIAAALTTGEGLSRPRGYALAFHTLIAAGAGLVAIAAGAIALRSRRTGQVDRTIALIGMALAILSIAGAAFLLVKQ